MMLSLIGNFFLFLLEETGETEKEAIGPLVFIVDFCFVESCSMLTYSRTIFLHVDIITVAAS
jgi:hypothetical protein